MWFDSGPFDARRWTVYAGPDAPDTVQCALAADAIPEMPTRSSLDFDGRFVVKAPRATTLAVLPLGDSIASAVRFLKIDQAKLGWQGQLDPGTEIAAVWERPFAGPGSDWISSFWSATAGETR